MVNKYNDKRQLSRTVELKPKSYDGLTSDSDLYWSKSSSTNHWNLCGDARRWDTRCGNRVCMRVYAVMLATPKFVSWDKYPGLLLFFARVLLKLRDGIASGTCDRNGPSATQHLHWHLRSYNSSLCRPHRRLSRTSCERKGGPKPHLGFLPFVFFARVRWQ